METEEEISPETNAEEDETLTEDAVEIDLEDDDLPEFLPPEYHRLQSQDLQTLPHFHMYQYGSTAPKHIVLQSINGRGESNNPAHLHSGTAIVFPD